MTFQEADEWAVANEARVATVGDPASAVQVSAAGRTVSAALGDASVDAWGEAFRLAVEDLARLLAEDAPESSLQRTTPVGDVKKADGAG